MPVLHTLNGNRQGVANSGLSTEKKKRISMIEILGLISIYSLFESIEPDSSTMVSSEWAVSL